MLSLYLEKPELLRKQMDGAPVDAAAFAKLYKWCDLADCEGYCCSGGVEIDHVENDVIQKAVKENAQFFKDKGLTLPEPYFFMNENGYPEMEVRPFNYRPSTNLPKHFDHTSCVFRDDIGRCSLQMLSKETGHNDWHFKPLYCWLFPVYLEKDDKPCITLQQSCDEGYDDPNYPGFADYTQCGQQRCESQGKPGYEVFQRELKTLGEILGRDLIAEIKTALNIQEKAA